VIQRVPSNRAKYISALLSRGLLPGVASNAPPSSDLPNRGLGPYPHEQCCFANLIL
jgi:hypothetical protein